MSKLICPFCNGELVGTIGHPICRNQDCVMCDDSMPQELLELLARIKKQLEIYHEFVTKLYLNGDITDESLIRLQKRLYIQTKGDNNE